MAKAFEVTALVATALCFSSLLSFSSANPTSDNEKFYVEGMVYCDTCRVEFETKLSEPLEDVKVVLECRNRENGELKFRSDALTNENGLYNISVEGDHGDEICEVHLGDSSKAECSEKFAIPYARIVLTTNVGVAGPVRHANPLGYKKKEALADCPQVLREMGVNPDDYA